MTETFSARVRRDRAHSESLAAQARAEERLAVVRRLQDALAAGDPRASEQQLDAALGAQAELDRVRDQLAGVLAGAQDELAQALDAEAKLFADAGTDPIALLPVRVETIWWEPGRLRVRVYPDDILMCPFDSQLTETEAAIGAEYWRSPGPSAWQHVQDLLRPARAAWAVRACRPGAAPPVVRPAGDAPRPRTVPMPRRWRFVGLLGGEVVVDKMGRRPVPDPLPIGLLRAEEEGWETDWFEALKAGMAEELTFPEGVETLDELLVVGVRDEPATQGAARIADLLLGHAYGAGLGLLAPGTATNNTPQAHSGWSSTPTFPRPDPQGAAPAGEGAADALVAALGLPDAQVLREAPGATDREQAAIEALSLLTWPTLGAGFVDAAVSHLDLSDGSVRSVDPARPWRSIRDHLARHVRSRGPLPMLRVGRQPYGVLPATSLDDWRAARAGEADALIVPWLQRLRELWRTVVATDALPRIRPGEPIDQVTVDALQRLPVATGLAMRRLNSPAFTVPGTPRDEPPSDLELAGLTPDGALRWTTRSDGWTDLGWGPDEITDAPAFVDRLTPDPTAFPARALATAEYLQAVRSFLAGQLDAAGYDQAWPVELSSGRETPPRRSTFFDLEPPPDIPDTPEAEAGPPDATGLLDALLFLPNWSSLGGDDGEDDPLRQALAVTGDVDQLVADVVEGLVSERERADRIAAATRAATALPRLEQAFRELAAVPVGRLPELLVEVIDVYSHRLDAWITSLATRRLAQLREAGVGGVRFGCYGWVSDLRAPVAREQVDIEVDEGPDTATVSAQDGYIHAPSLHHAASAAVLRSGFLGHPGDQAYAVNLTSRRARIARWLLGAVRRGQNLGSLLGYRFERALHDAELDHLIERFRRQFPLPLVAESDGERADPDLWARSAEAVAARNVVDGMALVRAGEDAPSQPSVIDGEPVVPHDDRTAVFPLLADLDDALDAVGDLILAESVHQLVGGNPIRAGLAADTLGRGEDVPDTFQVLRTPHRARALTQRLGVLLRAEPGPTEWPLDPLADLQPALEAWAAGLLGPAAACTLAGILLPPAGAAGAGQEFTLTADRLGLGALSTVLDAASASPSRLTGAALRELAAQPGARVSFAGPGWDVLHGLSVRIRSLLAGSQPLLPGHLPGQPEDRQADVTELRGRVARFATSPEVAGHPAAAVLEALGAEPIGPGGLEGWLSRARAALAEVLGADVPLLPALTGPALTGRPEAVGAAMEEWLRRNAAVRPVVRTVHETLLLAGARTGRPATLHAVQDPQSAGDPWIGAAFGAGQRPAATSHLVWHAPRDVPPGVPAVGLSLDEWIEVLPGADAPVDAAGSPEVGAPGEMTGVAFHYDRPDAKAPHNLILAVPPDLDRGWTADGLLQVLRETLELARLRAVDLADLPRLDELVPAIRLPSKGASGRFLTAIETSRPGTDARGPFRLEPGHRSGGVQGGLAARVHDPLWLLTRQWQFGEFTAQDAGSPAVVRMSGASAPIDAWRPGVASDWVPYDLGQGPLDAQVEDEPVHIDVRLRAEGGAALLRVLDDAGLLAAATPLLHAHRLHVDPAGTGASSLLTLVDGLLPDAEAVATALDTGALNVPLGDPVHAALLGWRSWWAGQLLERGEDCFDPHRFEHRMELSTAGTVLRAEEYLGDGLDWYSWDVHPDAEVAAAAAGDRQPFREEGLPTLVRYGGLPSDRFWEMEDARIDLGATDLSRLDTGRLLLVSFATVYGNDWFLVPLPVPLGSLTVLEPLLVRDVFGRYHQIRRAGRDDPSWSMFTLHGPDPDSSATSGLLVLPTERGQVGPAVETVVLARDELANLAWAIQHGYTDSHGEWVDRLDTWARRAPRSVPLGDLPRYGVQTVVPDYWFPLVPEALAAGVIRFRLARLTGPGLDARPEGRLIAPGLWVHEEEIPREGVRLTRRPVLARWIDGSWHSWVRREKAPGAGESSSGLAFDTIRPSEPWPGAE